MSRILSAIAGATATFLVTFWRPPPCPDCSCSCAPAVACNGPAETVHNEPAVTVWWALLLALAAAVAAAFRWLAERHSASPLDILAAAPPVANVGEEAAEEELATPAALRRRRALCDA